MFDVNIIATGSTGNSIVIDDFLMFDCGLPKKIIFDKLLDVDYTFITHRHGDHLNLALLKNLAKERPWFLRSSFYVNADTLELIKAKCPVEAEYIQTDELIDSEFKKVLVNSKTNKEYKIETFMLYHDVENYGFILTNEENETLIFATDTNTLAYAPNIKYDYIVVEGNYDEDKLYDMLASDSKALRDRAVRNLRHLSTQAFDDFVNTHSHENTIIYQLHESADLGISSDKITNYEVKK